MHLLDTSDSREPLHSLMFLVTGPRLTFSHCVSAQGNYYVTVQALLHGTVAFRSVLPVFVLHSKASRHPRIIFAYHFICVCFCSLLETQTPGTVNHH